MLQQTIICINLICAVIILNRGVFHVINVMTSATYFPVRAAWVLMTTGALAILVGPLFGFYVVSPYVTLLHAGVALFMFKERRIIGGNF